MYARAMRREVINAHLLGILPQLVDRGDRDHPSCHFQALLAMVYWHLLHIATQGVVQRCADASCRSVLCADAAHATVLSRGPSCARQPVRGARPEAGWAAASVDLAGAVMCAFLRSLQAQ